MTKDKNLLIITILFEQFIQNVFYKNTDKNKT
jgi:hypothetical protein